MCGRYTLFKLSQILNSFPWIGAIPGIVPRFNIAPSQPILTIANNHPDRFELFQWGLVPSWAKDPSIGNRMINARAETVGEKAAFKTSLRKRRCLIPADGFYEWRKEPDGKTKTPIHVHLKSAEPFAFAGLWDVWHDPGGGPLLSCTILTTRPNALMQPIHDRMPAIIKPSDYQAWLDPAERPAEGLLPLLEPYPADEMESAPVSRYVNRPGNEGERCIEPVESDSLF